MARLTVAALGLSLALVLAGAGCGGGGGTASETTATTTTTTPAKTTTVRLYFLRNGQMWPVSRSATKQQRRPGEPPWVAVGRTGLDALNRLWAGPLAREQSEMGLSTSMPQITAYADLLIVGSNSAIYKPSAPLSRNALAQVVYTLTQFPTVKSVKYKGKH